MNARKPQQLRSALAEFVDELTREMGRRDRRAWAETNIRGLLLDGQRKSIEPMARRLEEIDQSSTDYEQSLQQFVNQSLWDERQVLKSLARWVKRRLKNNPFLIVEGVGFPKKGDHSVGVARQYCGTLGKVANCQIAVTLQVAQGKDVFAIDAELYLPQRWFKDEQRLRAAKVPTEVVYLPKWKLALAMIQRAREAGFEGVVLVGSEFGSVTDFRLTLVGWGMQYAVGIDSTLSVIDAAIDLGEVPPRKTSMGRLTTRPAAVDHASDFRRVTWRLGAKGPMASRFAAWRVRPGHGVRAGRTPDPAIWLIAEWPADQEHPTKYYFSNLPRRTSLKQLVRAVRSRWPIEQSYRELKNELSLDHFEGRSWRGWRHHVAMVFLAYAFLVSLRRKKGARRLRVEAGSPRIAASAPLLDRPLSGLQNASPGTD